MPPGDNPSKAPISEQNGASHEAGAVAKGAEDDGRQRGKGAAHPGTEEDEELYRRWEWG